MECEFVSTFYLRTWWFFLFALIPRFIFLCDLVRKLTLSLIPWALGCDSFVCVFCVILCPYLVFSSVLLFLGAMLLYLWTLFCTCELLFPTCFFSDMLGPLGNLRFDCFLIELSSKAIVCYAVWMFSYITQNMGSWVCTNQAGFDNQYFSYIFV